jgi:hypothetical protein
MRNAIQVVDRRLWITVMAWTYLLPLARQDTADLSFAVSRAEHLPTNRPTLKSPLFSSIDSTYPIKHL